MLTLQHPDQTQPIPEDLHVRQADDMLSIHWMSTLSFSEWHGLLTRIIADNSIQDLMECSVLS